MDGINLWAVLVAAVSSFLLGGIWYGPLFGKAWNAAAGMDSQKQGHPAKIFGGAFVFSLLAAAVFAWFLGPQPPLSFAVCRGVLVGFGLVAASFGINYLFAQRGVRLWLIDGGYHTVQFALFGLVLGLWH
ncbi:MULTISPECIES: DUF1761 domain-containing protein [unclassified Pseudoxanthomonas]|uniref:DUF1761 domain-containing protein n=1 Tax=unclassified Pseudoxanthomonas TaxID=2645906 RepID=UPI0008E7C3F4|nr:MULTISPECIES: DUF1761 domain-containing protein [unclassified Pseudoxanthomonas]PPJ42810.1 DUF1761 domain-containing protein [Pseudoxanthomonas sp. KAs_5_3]SFV26255.1 Protein of unknown function [Pseudoxanthomonas sp. YR558]